MKQTARPPACAQGYRSSCHGRLVFRKVQRGPHLNSTGAARGGASVDHAAAHHESSIAKHGRRVSTARWSLPYYQRVTPWLPPTSGFPLPSHRRDVDRPAHAPVVSFERVTVSHHPIRCKHRFTGPRLFDFRYGPSVPPAPPHPTASPSVSHEPVFIHASQMAVGCLSRFSGSPEAFSSKGRSGHHVKTMDSYSAPSSDPGGGEDSLACEPRALAGPESTP